MLSEKVSELSC